MKMTKGHPKAGGRKAGTPNKATAAVKAYIADVIGKYMQPTPKRRKADAPATFEEDLQALTPAERVRAMQGLANFIIPKQQAISIEEQTQIETEALTEWLKTAPQDAIDGIAAKILELQAINGTAEA